MYGKRSAHVPSPLSIHSPTLMLLWLRESSISMKRPDSCDGGPSKTMSIVGTSSWSFMLELLPRLCRSYQPGTPVLRSCCHAPKEEGGPSDAWVVTSVTSAVIHGSAGL